MIAFKIVYSLKWETLGEKKKQTTRPYLKKKTLPNLQNGKIASKGKRESGNT